MPQLRPRFPLANILLFARCCEALRLVSEAEGGQEIQEFSETSNVRAAATGSFSGRRLSGLLGLEAAPQAQPAQECKDGAKSAGGADSDLSDADKANDAGHGHEPHGGGGGHSIKDRLKEEKAKRGLETLEERDERHRSKEGDEEIRTNGKGQRVRQETVMRNGRPVKVWRDVDTKRFAKAPEGAGTSEEVTAEAEAESGGGSKKKEHHRNDSGRGSHHSRSEPRSDDSGRHGGSNKHGKGGREEDDEDDDDRKSKNHRRGRKEEEEDEEDDDDGDDDDDDDDDNDDRKESTKDKHQNEDPPWKSSQGAETKHAAAASSPFGDAAPTPSPSLSAPPTPKGSPGKVADGGPVTSGPAAMPPKAAAGGPAQATAAQGNPCPPGYAVRAVLPPMTQAGVPAAPAAAVRMAPIGQQQQVGPGQTAQAPPGAAGAAFPKRAGVPMPKQAAVAPKGAVPGIGFPNPAAGWMDNAEKPSKEEAECKKKVEDAQKAEQHIQQEMANLQKTLQAKQVEWAAFHRLAADRAAVMQACKAAGTAEKSLKEAKANADKALDQTLDSTRDEDKEAGGEGKGLGSLDPGAGAGASSSQKKEDDASPAKADPEERSEVREQKHEPPSTGGPDKKDHKPGGKVSGKEAGDKASHDDMAQTGNEGQAIPTGNVPKASAVRIAASEAAGEKALPQPGPSQAAVPKKRHKKHSKEGALPHCNGWSPSSGALAGKGGFCDYWGDVVKWCFVEEFEEGAWVKEAKGYEGRKYSVCDE
eukprot:TRINITY_DN6687_c0_g1_i2.p1 TRINITY_DN6687_c0_g1~~TRINITY_DN6687_c0_g1_i2.p1  ORF type:complete len:756 (-),score=243.65 TRINITY_DN6687_c0_g1_i2:186-2453(-)